MKLDVFVRTTIAFSLVLASACASRAKVPIPTVAADGCPVVLLTRSGGLGFESQSGVIAAVWPSGTIIRAESAAGGRVHIIGTLAPVDLAALNDLVNAPRLWEQPRGEPVLDFPDDILIVRRGNETRKWAETPGFTSTPALGEYRAKLFSVPIQGAKRLNDELPDLEGCGNAK